MRALLIAALIALLVVPAWADGPLFRQHKPNYIITNYGQDEADSTQNPWIKYQASYAMMVTEDPIELPYLPDIHPVIAFTITSWWRAFDESSPFEETNYNPEIFLEMLPDSAGWFRGLRAGLEHVSTGVAGENSRGWNRVTGELKLAWRDLVVYAQLWGVFGVDEGTEGIEDVTSLAPGHVRELGGSLLAVLDREGYRLAGGRAKENWIADAMVQLYGSNLYAYGQLYSGKGERLTKFDADKLTGGAGIALMRR